MKNKIILNGSDWYLAGWNRHQWKYERSMETSSFSVPFMGGIPATVPGSVQTDLLKAGLIEDWNYGTNFRKINSASGEQQSTRWTVAFIDSGLTNKR